MNIYGELLKNKLRLEIGAELIEVNVTPNFYSKANGKDAYNMFLDANTNSKISDFVTRHRNRLGLYEKFRYVFLRNRALLLVNRDVQKLLTIRRVVAYATLSLDARTVYVMKSPDKMSVRNLETLEDIKDANLNTGNVNGDTPISDLS